MVPDGVEEVELARINLEQTERERKLLLDYIRDLSTSNDASRDLSPSTEDGDVWMIMGEKNRLVRY